MTLLEATILLTSFLALLSAITQRTHILMMILSLEAVSLTFALMFSLLFSPFSEDYMGIILLTFAAAETAIALALLTTLTRLLGSDSISTCSLSLMMVRQKLDIIDGDKNGL